MSRISFVCWVLLVVLPAAGIWGAEKEPADAIKPVEWDLSTFPKIDGKVVQVLGNLNSYVPPRVGAEVHWDLKTISQLMSLPFVPESNDPDAEREYYIPLSGARKGADSLSVESVKTYGNGVINSMRLIARSEIPGSPHVKVDIRNLPGRGDPNFVEVWVLVESNVIHGLVLIEAKADYPFPNKNGPKEPIEATPDATKPIETALAYVREQKFNLSRHNAENASASRYCPPQSTIYQWCVVIPAKPDSQAQDLWIAIPATGSPWRLDPKTLEKIPD